MTDMLRQFSVKRMVGFFILDWLGSLVMLLCAAMLRACLGQLPKSVVDFLGSLHVQVGGAGGGVGGGVSPLQMWASIWGGAGGGVWPLLIAVTIIWPIFFIIFSVYDGRHNRTLWLELKNVFFAICLSMLALAGFLFLTYRETSRGLFLIFFGLDGLLLLGSRIVLWAYRRIGSRGGNDHPRGVLIVGAGAVGRNSVQQLKKYAWFDLELIGYLDDDPKKQGCEFEGYPVLGKLDRVFEVVNAHQIQDAVIALPMRAYQTLIDICEKLQELSIRVHVIPDMFALSFPNAELDGFGGIPVIDLGLAGLQGMPRFEKRVFDVLIASIILVIISPILLGIAILIKLNSPGPVIYLQKRIGENGKPFVMYKFRSMRVDADPSIHQEYVTRLIKENLEPGQLKEKGRNSLKMEDDPRITWLGHFIRRASLDELPQFFNVLRGEMSLVGPRPSLPYELEHYQDWHKRRLEALPGITGLWQVRGRNRVSFDEMVRMDLDYIQHQSIWMDLLILLQTPWAVISTRGAG
jgi:exopolysaccharide biosynthesis polyprenyl glycosylphosphotransferase